MPTSIKICRLTGEWRWKMDREAGGPLKLIHQSDGWVYLQKGVPKGPICRSLLRKPAAALPFAEEEQCYCREPGTLFIFGFFQCRNHAGWVHWDRGRVLKLYCLFSVDVKMNLVQFNAWTYILVPFFWSHWLIFLFFFSWCGMFWCLMGRRAAGWDEELGQKCRASSFFRGSSPPSIG